MDEIIGHLDNLYDKRQGKLNHPAVELAMLMGEPLKLIRRVEGDFPNKNAADKWCEDRSGYCAGLFTLKGVKHWYCYIRYLN